MKNNCDNPNCECENCTCDPCECASDSPCPEVCSISN